MGQKVECERHITSLESEHGKPKVHFSVGGTTPTEFLKKCGIELKSKKVAMDENYQTKTPGLYAAGDIVTETGGSIAIAKHIAQKSKTRESGGQR